MNRSNEEALLSVAFDSEYTFKECLSNGITSQHFTDERAKAIWEKACNLENEVSIETLYPQLDLNCQNYLLNLTQDRVISTPILYWCEAVKKDFFKRDLRQRTQDLLLTIDGYDHSQLHELLRQYITLGTPPDYIRAPKVYVDKEKIIVALEASVSKMINDRKNGRCVGIPTGIPSLDQLVDGFMPGRVYILAARPGLGKTTLAMNFALSASKRKFSTSFLTVEMTMEEIALKMCSRFSQINHRKLQSGDLDDEGLDKFIEALRKFKESEISIIVNTRHIEDIIYQAEKTKEIRGLDFLVLDYLQLFRTREKIDNRREQIGKITSEIKALAQRLQIPVLLLSQINRAVERDNRLPGCADLKESGHIEEDADVVMFIHQLDINKHQLLLDKNRHGQKGVVMLGVDFSVNYMGSSLD